MTIASMTGFARADGADGEWRWTWEIRSVNGRNLEIRTRLPAGFEALDPEVRARVPEHCRRGNVSVSLTLARGAAESRVQVNRGALDQLIALAAELRRDGAVEPPRLDGLLAVRGVVELVEEGADEALRNARTGRLAESLAEGLAALRAMRLAEGERLARLAEAHLVEIERLCAAAGAAAAAQPEALRARLRAQLQLLLDNLPAIGEERLAQEAALLVGRGDVREELDRLAAHVAAARALLAEGGAVGRRLDFLCQEFNREANTLCAKSSDVELTRIGLAIKAAVEQLREQVQNIE